MTTFVDDMQILSQFLVDKLIANKNELGLQDVFYGDQTRIPRTPAVCVEPVEKTRELTGAPRRVTTDITIQVLVYHNPVTSTQTIREQDDALAEDIEALIHADPQFLNVTNQSPQVLSSLVSRIESGYQQKANSLYRASRLTVDTTMPVQLPTPV